MPLFSSYNVQKIITWPSPNARWRLVWSVHMMKFSIHLGKASTTYTAHFFSAEASRMFSCVLSLPQWRCYHKFDPRASLEQFWLRWFSPLCTYWGQVYWHNASLVAQCNAIKDPIKKYCYHGMSSQNNVIYHILISWKMQSADSQDRYNHSYLLTILVK